MADKAIDDLGRDQMEFAEEVLILFENNFFFFQKKKEKMFSRFVQFSFYFCHANSFFILHFLKKVNTN